MVPLQSCPIARPRGPHPPAGRAAVQQPEQAAEVIIGVDTHKDTHTAVALDTLGARLGTTTIPVSREGYVRSRRGVLPRLGPGFRDRVHGFLRGRPFPSSAGVGTSRSRRQPRRP